MTTRPYQVKVILRQLNKVAVTEDYRDDGRYQLLSRLVDDAVLASDTESLTTVCKEAPSLEADRLSKNLPAEAEYFGRLSQKCQETLPENQTRD